MGCPVCENKNAKVPEHVTRDASFVDCPQCGQFTISDSAIATLNNTDKSQSWKLSAWINEFAPSVISTTDIDTALSSTIPSLHHRLDRMLRWINNQFPPGREFQLSNVLSAQDPNASRLLPVGWNRTNEEMRYMVSEALCNEMGLLVREHAQWFKVSPKGLLYLEGQRDEPSSIGFCAMWFSPEVLPLWTQVIEPAIRAAGYDPLRIDAKEHNGKIDDEIMASIRAARFVVSDFTGNRGGVYYEAGFAHGLGLPVIFMCREGDDLHFDVRQYNCIFWKPDALEEAKERLKNRLLATLGRGPLRVQ